MLLVPAMGPETGRHGFAGAGRQHLYRGVVREGRLSGQRVPPDGIGQRFQRHRRLANPIDQRLAAKIKPIEMVRFV
jgi:hypothetical protein